jgi:flagellar assembly protein FliH
MSSKILRRGAGSDLTQPWRGAGEAEVAPPQEEQRISAATAESARLREAIATLEARLAAAVRNAEERETRAREAGRKDGYVAGQKEGLAAAQSEANRTIAALQAEAGERAAGAAAQAVDMRRRLRQQMESDLVRLAVAVARRILRRELSVDPDALLGIVKAVVERIAARELLTIRVCPRDAARIEARLADLNLPDRVQVIADNSLTWGALLFDTTRGQHDASVETQIEEIDRGLADLVGRPE